MLNEKKIHTMTKLAMFEEKKGKEDLKINKYYRIDYIRLRLYNSFVCVTIGYVILLAAVILYYSEYLLQNAVKLNYKEIGAQALIIYIVLLIVYGFITILVSMYSYDRAKKRLKKYKKNLKMLQQFYNEEMESKQEEIHDESIGI
ncbi:hypothetical protein [Anaeromicropila populeti]|uniref:Uncharacterized protein n=1 Tax=Anaeromicropila populeti TaxID=37658 RepID=A0A1I6HS41_9FIRM|nr:hypothetical protein [Anaeromicropila populeti]SFR57245.1 hypothetical protein SAMN05661086_00219 [Anaeromicropila populeti]